MSTRRFSSRVLKVVNDVAKQQFTVTIQTASATLDYEKSGQNITYIYTNVPKECQGRGVGKLLAKHAFDYAHESNLSVTCQCHFLAKYFNDNLDNYKGLKVFMDLQEEKK